MFLRSLVHEQSRSWLEILPWTELQHNSTYNVSIGMCPFMVLYRKEVSSFSEFTRGGTSNLEVDEELLRRCKIIERVKLHLERINTRIKFQADKQRKDIELAIGDWVLVKLKPYCQISVAHRLNRKLSPHCFGPFIMETKISAVAYRVRIPTESLIHNVFHISLLRKYKGDVPPKEVLKLLELAV